MQSVIHSIEIQKDRKLTFEEELLIINTAFFVFREWDLYYKKVTA
jgi:hypothetical protein